MIMTNPTVETLARGFDNVATQYDRSRPTYSVKIFHNLPVSFRTNCRRIVEVGAGTGLFTKLLVDYFPLTTQIIAIEPLTNMRSILVSKFSKHSNVEVYDGTADKLNVDSNSVNAIFCAQSFHWFANINSLKEFQRILSPHNSYVIMVWNREAWNTDTFLSEIIAKLFKDNRNYPRSNYDKQYQDMQNKLLTKQNLIINGIDSFEGFKFIWMNDTHQIEKNSIEFIDLILSWSGFAASTNEERVKCAEMIEKSIIYFYGSMNITLQLPYSTYLIFSRCNKNTQSKL